MQPIVRLPLNEKRALRGLLFDLDDTVLDHGKLSEAAYSALFRLKEAAFTLICVTGRPAAWAELICRQWPVDAAVAENGALAYMLVNGRPRCIDSLSKAQREERRARLESIVQTFREEFDDIPFATDTALRVSDATFDIGEYVSIPPERVAFAMERAKALGASGTRSSVHLHLSLDKHDKASGTLALLRREFGAESTRARFEYAFIGDSENDQSCFAAFRTTIGVKNLRGRPSLLPRYQTEAARGQGFAEAAAVLVDR